jgi:hypothetical protein
MLEGEAMKRTKLQREAFKMARWWMDGDNFNRFPNVTARASDLDIETRNVLHACDVWEMDAYASAILSEVM